MIADSCCFLQSSQRYPNSNLPAEMQKGRTLPGAVFLVG
jgi:hypothetical protein